MISILILTKNEEKDLPDCLESVVWSDDIHIFDSFSNDSTLEIAKRAGVNIHQRQFDGFASQRNAALNEVEFKYDWVLILDADERIPVALKNEIFDEFSKMPEDIKGFRIRRRDYFFDTWLKHAQITPFYIRLIKKSYAFYIREINEVLQVEGNVKELSGHFIHFPFSKGIDHWLNKHNQYSTLEAARWIEEHDINQKFSILKALFAKDFSEKRYHQKGLFYKLPMRPLLKWFYMMFLRMSFLDGFAGITYATLQCIYEYFIVLKTKEMQAARAKRN